VNRCPIEHGRIRCGLCGRCAAHCRCEQLDLVLECPKCHDVKQLDFFPLDSRNKTLGRQTPCRRCQSASVKAWKQRVGYSRLRRNTQQLLRRAAQKQQRALLAWARSS
jgi:hypothetical protein